MCALVGRSVSGTLKAPMHNTGLSLARDTGKLEPDIWKSSTISTEGGPFP